MSALVRRILVGTLLAVASTGCYRINVKATPAAAPATVEWDDRWHHGVVYGLAELSGPYDLSKICPKGWGLIHTETDFLTGLVTGLTWNIYTPQKITVRCAAPAP